MKIQHHIVELRLEGAGPPIFDIEIQRLSAEEPARALHVFARVERSEVLVGGQPRGKLITCIMFAVDPDQPKEKRRLGLLTMAGEIPEEIAETSKYLGVYHHPNSGEPVSVYEFPWTPLQDATADEPMQNPSPADVIAAIETARAKIEAAKTAVVIETQPANEESQP